MPRRPPGVCSYPGCHVLVATGFGPCGRHRLEARRESDAKRPTAAQRGYGAEWRKRRVQFLKDHPICVDCGGRATVADHYPRSRRELVAAGVEDPDDVAYLVPRCEPDHNRSTAKNQPGGWNQR